MKGLICYFSTTGNTRLACEYIARRLKNAAFDFLDIARRPLPDLTEYGIVGFAAFADYFGPSRRVIDFINQIPRQEQKPAFVFNTYGNINGRTLLEMRRRVREKGFFVVAGFALQTPENYPPLVAAGMANLQFPTEVQLAEFHRFIESLDQAIATLTRGEKPLKMDSSEGFLTRLLPLIPRGIGRMVMGKKSVDASICTRCGLCRDVCPYGAIELTQEQEPVFDETKCYACWSCYNHCPARAIFTKRLKHAGHYPGPAPELREKLK